MSKLTVYEIVGGEYKDSTGKQQLVSTFLADPNPQGNDTFPQEDLFIYIDLTARPKSRSIILSQNSNATDFVSTGVDYSKPVSFITTTKQNGKDYVTTNFMSIDGQSNSVEGFGIQSINMDIGADFTPQVEIKFFDVRGGSFSQFDDYGGSIFSDSPLAVFFKLPYPIFELKIKGFYGKAVTYCLNLLSWSASFDTDSGGFVITAKFIGYTYAFLADIPIKHVWAISQTPQGREKLKDKKNAEGDPIIPFSEMMSKFGQLTRLTEEYKSDSRAFKNLKIYNSALAKLRKIQTAIGKKMVEGSDIFFTEPINTSNITENKEQIFIRDVGIIAVERYDDYLSFIKGVQQDISDYNDIIGSLGEPLGFGREALPTMGAAHSLEKCIDVVKSKVSDNEPTYNTSTITEAKVRTVFSPSSSSFSVVDYFAIRAKTANLVERLSKKKTEKEKDAIKELNDKAVDKVGFSPTVENTFSIICGNVDAYLEVLHDYSMKAASQGLEEGRRSGVANYRTDVSSVYSNKIHPFPDVINENDEKQYIGSAQGISRGSFPEIELTEILIKGINNIYTEENKKNFYDDIKTNITTDADDFFPSNPIDYGDSSYDALNIIEGGGIMNTGFVDILLNKMYSYYDIGNTTNVQNLLTFAKIEGNLMAENLVNPLIRDMVANISDFTQQVVDIIYDNLLLPDWKKGNVTINGTDLKKEDILIYSQEQSLYGNITSNAVSLSEKNSALFDKLNIGTEYNAAYSDGYLLEKDFSYAFRDRASTSRILDVLVNNPSSGVQVFSYNEPYGFIVIEKMDDMRFLDGKNLFYLGLDKVLSAGNAQLFISGGKALSSYPQYTSADAHMRYFMTLATFGFQRDVTAFFNEISKYTGIGYFSAQYLHYIGALYHILDNNLATINESTDSYAITISNPALSGIFVLPKIADGIKTKLKKYFTDYVSGQFSAFEKDLIDYKILKAKNIISTNDPDYAALSALYGSLLDTLNSTETIVVLNTGKNNGASETLVRQYMDAFHTEYKNAVTVQRTDGATRAEDVNFEGQSVFDDDFKLAVYDSLKAIYDKWLAYGEKNGRIYNSCFDGGQTGQKEKGLIDYFHFIDRTWSDIGDRAVINPKILMNLSSNYEETLYGFITKILNDSKFLVFFAPVFVGNKTIHDMEEMFLPHTTIKDASGGSAIIAMYTGGNSRNLEIPAGEFVNDGFDFQNESVFPKKFSNRKVAFRHVDRPEEREKYNISAFLVEYAKENQHHFRNVQVSSEEHYNTNEYLLAMSDVFDKGGTSKRFYKGLDIYNLYQVRSYKSSVMSMGNMMIQPMGYYQLNIPLFKGVYLITKVSHSITPHNHETEFSGYRVPSYVYPLVQEITSFIKLVPDEIFDTEAGDTDLLGFVEGSDGTDGTISTTLGSDVLAPARASNNVLFDLDIIK